MTAAPDPRLAALSSTLRALAEKASRWAAWEWATSCSYRRMPGVMDPIVHIDGQADIAVNDDDMAYIAAANPAVVLSLLDALAAAEGERDGHAAVIGIIRAERDALAASLAGAEAVVEASRLIAEHHDHGTIGLRGLRRALTEYDEAGGEGRGTV